MIRDELQRLWLSFCFIHYYYLVLIMLLMLVFSLFHIQYLLLLLYLCYPTSLFVKKCFHSKYICLIFVYIHYLSISISLPRKHQSLFLYHESSCHYFFTTKAVVTISLPRKQQSLFFYHDSYCLMLFLGAADKLFHHRQGSDNKYF